MARAVRRRWAKTVNGKRVVEQTRKRYAEYTDANGVRRRVPGYTDKAATEQLAARLERDAAREAEGLGPRSAAARSPSTTTSATTGPHCWPRGTPRGTSS
jgi:hypothetical protein